MRPTYTSKPINIIDMPVPSRPQLQFHYNFFQADERVSDTPPKLARPITALTPRELSTKVPRYISISWDKVHFNPIRSSFPASQPNFLDANQKIITDESQILSDAAILYFQDFDHSNRIGERFESSARLRGLLSGSSTDVASKLNAVTSKSSDGDVIQRYLSIASQNRSLFISEDSLIEPVDSSAADQLSVVLDTDYFDKVTRDASSSPVSSVASVVRQNSKTMIRSAKKRTSKMPLEDDLELTLDSIDDFAVSSPPGASKIQQLGYIIERYEIDIGDIIKKSQSVFISSINIGSYIDTRIKYGIQYVYCVRSVGAFFVSTTRDNGDMQNSRFLVASRPSTFSSVLTEEHVPPPPPADINFRWDYQRASLQIDWAFPTNPQLDIKKWQIFRRKSISEAFSLIAQLDFDDSVVKTPPKEAVDKSLVKSFNSSITFYIDPEFDKDSNFIYAVCAGDAHGMTSNYSSQYQISFDRIKNKLKKTMISSAGAAKQYPNTYLQAELSLDSVKSSNSEKIKIFFDPEYLKVNDHFGRDMHFLKSNSRGGTYRFMLLNTDRQKQSNIDITINDLRELRLDGSARKD